MRRIIFTLPVIFTAVHALAQNNPDDRATWLRYLDQVARPVFSNLAGNTLKKNMPVELSDKPEDEAAQKAASYLEAFGRTLSGIAPWLNLEGGPQEEVELRNLYRALAVKAVTNAVDPAAKDYLKWNGAQPLVDASFFAYGLIRCPWLWRHLGASVQQHVVDALKTTRGMVPSYSNWLLFSGMIEAFFLQYGYDYDATRIEFSVREFASHWYVGDGLFSDGMHFRLDYYNSIVIHPFLTAIVTLADSADKRYTWFAPKLDTMNRRYAEILEREINTDGTYPVIGRSIAYRSGVFHHLADMALRRQLPPSLKPAQIRSALTAVIRQTIGAPGTFDDRGWLTIGLHGHQRSIGDYYITTGSLYLCADVFLPLGLPANDPFWTDPPEPWTSVKAWRGEDVPGDRSLDLH